MQSVRAAAVISRRLQSAGVMPALLVRRAASSTPQHIPHFSANEAWLYARIQDNGAAIHALQREHYELRLENIKLTAAVSEADFAARDAIARARDETAQTAWRVVFFGVAGVVSCLSLINLHTVDLTGVPVPDPGSP